MTSLVRDAEILSAEIRNIFGDLEANGFKIQMPSINYTDAIGEYAEVLVLNSVTGKSLLFMYTPAKDIRPEGMVIILQNRSGDSFSIDEYLMYKNINFKFDDSLNLTKYNGSLANKFEGLLSASKKIITQHLDKYLFGGEWEIIPIYWGDMK